MKKYYPYVYLDNDQVDILYPQVFGDIIEKIVTQSDGEAIDMSARASLFNILGSDIGSKINNSTVENIKIVTSAARKAQLLINYFMDDAIISAQDFITKYSPFDESILFVSKAKFGLREIHNKRTGESLLLKRNRYYENDSNSLFVLDDDSLLVLESGNYDLSFENEFTGNNYGIVMHLSNSKIKKDVRHLTSEIGIGASFKFFVFGELLQVSEQFYRINPFAVWQ